MNYRIIRAFFKNSEFAVFFDENLPNLTASQKMHADAGIRRWGIGVVQRRQIDRLWTSLYLILKIRIEDTSFLGSIKSQTADICSLVTIVPLLKARILYNHFL